MQNDVMYCIIIAIMRNQDEIVNSEIFQVLHLTGQIEILGKWLTEIISEKNGYRLNFKMIRKIVQKHQDIITFSKNIENLYSDIALILVVSDILILCCIGFILVTVSNRDKSCSRKGNNSIGRNSKENSERRV